MALFFSIRTFFPKYSVQLIFMLVIVAADFYLWSSLKKQVFNYRYWLRVLIIAVYWFPLLLLLVIIVGSLVKPVLLWNDAIRTYMVGTVMIFYSAKLIPILFLILADVIRGIQKLVHLSSRNNRVEVINGGNDNYEITRSKFLQYTGFVSGGLILGTMFTGMLKWVYEFKIHKEKIAFKNLPKKFNNLKIVQISDLHLGSWASKKPLQRAVDIINELEPDLIFFTGDLVNYATKEAYGFEQVLSQLKAKLGTYAVLGNHDYGDYVAWPSEQAKKDNMIDLYQYYRSLGWNLLNNENQILNSSDGSIAVVGVENWGASNRFPKYGDLDKAMKGSEDADVKILLTHDPSHWEKVVIPGNYDIDLSLSGHTHGFQFGIETKEIKWSPAKYMYKQWAGLYEDDEKLGRYIYVNRGLGSIGYPGRIGILPEITFIELES